MQRPGQIKRSAFGYQFGLDKVEKSDREQVAVYQYSHSSISRHRDSLPVNKYRQHIQFLVETHQVVLILGETGSGKTTQIPQYLYEAGWCRNGQAICCTQPRRVAASSVAARVAEEMGETLGERVGYVVRFDYQCSKDSKIKFMTEGMLLRDMMYDPLLTEYSVILLDEVHERSVNIDILLALILKVLKVRPTLRVVIASATIDLELLSNYFSNATSRHSHAHTEQPDAHIPSLQPALLHVEGRQYDVTQHYLQSATADYIATTIQCVVDIHKSSISGSILVFMPGGDECEQVVDELQRQAHNVTSENNQMLKPLPLYAGLSYAAQQAAIATPSKEFRHAIIATNIAETSVTIPNIVHVVDCCLVRLLITSHSTTLTTLQTVPISKASAKQRAGRAGRVKPGHVYRLCTQQVFDSFMEYTVPEIQRCDLASAVLCLKALGVDNLMNMRWMAPPPADGLVLALEYLHTLGAIDHDAKLTDPLGQQIADLPLTPAMSKCLLSAIKYNVTSYMLIIISMQSLDSIWAYPRGQVKALENAKAKFAAEQGDLITMLNVYNAWINNNKNSKWCYRHFINARAMRRAQQIQQQLTSFLQKYDVQINDSDHKPSQNDVDPLLKSIVSGQQYNAAYYSHQYYDPLKQTAATHVYKLIRGVGEGHSVATGIGGSKYDDTRLEFRIHPSSVLHKHCPKWLVFSGVKQRSAGWVDLTDVTVVSKQLILDIAPHLYKQV